MPRLPALRVVRCRHAESYAKRAPMSFLFIVVTGTIAQVGVGSVCTAPVSAQFCCLCHGMVSAQGR